MKLKISHEILHIYIFFIRYFLIGVLCNICIHNISISFIIIIILYYFIFLWLLFDKSK